MTVTLEQLEWRVNDGISFLLPHEKVGRDRLLAIDDSDLDLGDNEKCILGKLYGSYADGYGELHPPRPLQMYGFTIMHSDVWGWADTPPYFEERNQLAIAFDQLTRIWKEALREMFPKED